MYIRRTGGLSISRIMYFSIFCRHFNPNDRTFSFSAFDMKYAAEQFGSFLYARKSYTFCFYHNFGYMKAISVVTDTEAEHFSSLFHLYLNAVGICVFADIAEAFLINQDCPNPS